VNLEVIEHLALINVEVQNDIQEFDPLYAFSRKGSHSHFYPQLKTFRVKGNIKDKHLVPFLILVLRELFPALEYCSIYTKLASGAVDVNSAIKEVIKDKKNEKK
jgi:hypothetical protein